MKKMILLLILAGVFSHFVLTAQEEAFRPGGKPEVNIFTNVSSVFSDGDNHNKADVTRAYLGYRYEFSRSLSGRITYDVGNPNTGKMHYTGFLKYAYLQYKTGQFTLTGGMIPMPEFEQENKMWGFRYLFKPFHDEYGFGTSADLGISLDYAFTPWLSADVVVANGETFKTMEMDSALRIGAGVTLLPVRNLTLRGYFDTMKKGEVNQQTFDVSVAYQINQINLSAAYNYQKDHSLIAGHDYSGFTINGSVPLNKQVKLTARFDQLGSVQQAGASQPWNHNKDGNLYLTGIEFSPAKGIKITPNFQGWDPADPEKSFISRVGLHLEIKI